MKSLKKLLAVLVVLSMMVSCVSFAAQFGDVEEGNTFQEAIDVLSDIGIVKGYEDGNYKPDKEVTRAEMTSLLMRMINLSITGITVPNSYYTDVASNHWAVYDINTASDRSIIKGFGGGLFKPDASVTFEQAVKMIVCVLGYERRAELEYGGWPNGYMRAAREFGLTNKCEMTQNEPAPRKIIAQLLYNALEVKMAENVPDTTDGYKLIDDTLLATYLRINKITGKVIANSKTRLDATESVVRDDEIQIDVNGDIQRHSVGTHTDAVDMIGLDVVAYTKMDDTNTYSTILNISTRKKVQKVTVDADDVISFNSSKLTYEKDGNGILYDLAVANGAKYLYNGKYISESDLFNNNLQIPEIGEITFTDSGSGYNLVSITSYTNYVVKTVDSANSKIYVDTAVTPAVNSIDVPVNNTLEWNITIKKGNNTIGLSSIRKGNIISVKSSAPSQTYGVKIMEILVSDSKTSGKVVSEDEDVLTIGTKEYKIAKSLLNVSDIMNKIDYGVSGTFYLDAFGKIAFVEFGASETYLNGYLTRAAKPENDPEANLTLKIFDASSKRMKTFTAAPKLSIDGEYFSDLSLALARLENTALLSNYDAGKVNAKYSQPIKYVVNSSNQVSQINTIDNSKDTADTFASMLDDSDIDNFEDGFKYNSSRYFTMSAGNTILVDSSAVVYIVPDDRHSDNDYIVTKITDSKYFFNNEKFRVELYAPSTTGSATVVVAHSDNLAADLTVNSVPFLFESKSTVSDGEGGIKTKLKGYNFITGATAEYVVENDAYIAPLDLTKGDIIRFGTNSDGEINDKVYLYLDVSAVSDGTNYGNVTVVTSNVNSDSSPFRDPSQYPFRFLKTNAEMKNFYMKNDDITVRTNSRIYMLGTPLAVTDEDSISIKYTDKIPGVDSDFDTHDEAVFSVSSSTLVFVYDSTAAEASKLTYVAASDTEAKTAQILTTKTYDIAANECDQIYLYSVSDNLRALYIIK